MSEKKYHIGKDGNVKQCRAKTESSCTATSDVSEKELRKHFSTPEAAESHYEKFMRAESKKVFKGLKRNPNPYDPNLLRRKKLEQQARINKAIMETDADNISVELPYNHHFTRTFNGEYGISYSHFVVSDEFLEKLPETDDVGTYLMETYEIKEEENAFSGPEFVFDEARNMFSVGIRMNLWEEENQQDVFGMKS